MVPILTIPVPVLVIENKNKTGSYRKVVKNVGHSVGAVILAVLSEVVNISL